MRRVLSFVLILILFTSTLYGCTIRIVNKNKEQPETSSEAVAYEQEFLGRATFTLDNTASASVDFLADGSSATVSVTDSAGLTWQLDIPQNALLYPQTVKMTAMRDVNIDALGAMSGGVLLEPDGLTFLSPATLTVTGDGFGENSIILTGNQDGSDITFAECVTSTNSNTATIYHFSSAYGSQFDDMDARNKFDEASAKQARKATGEGKKILNQELNVPVPPSLSFRYEKGKTKDPSEDAALQTFFNEFLKPEWPAANAIASAGLNSFTMRNSNVDYEDEVYDNFEVWAELISRLQAKADKLLEDYKYQEDKWKAISRVAAWATDINDIKSIAAAQKFVQEKNVKIILGNRNLLRGKMDKWGTEVWNYWMNELLEKHDYTAVRSLEDVNSASALVGVDLGDVEEKIRNAMKFDLEIEINMRTVAEYYFSYEITGTIPVQLTLGGDMLLGDGSGTCEYASVKCPIAQIISPSSYPCIATITKFDPCFEDVVTVSLDRIGAEEETWHYSLSGMTETNDWSDAEWLATKLFNKFDFEMNLQNLNANAVDQTFDKKATDDSLNLEGSIHLTLVHKPNN